MSFYTNNPHFNNIIKKKLEKKGFHEIGFDEVNHSKKIYYCDVTYGKKKYENFQKCQIMNQLENINKLFNKKNQYKYFIKYYGNTRKYIPYTISFERNNINNLQNIFEENKNKRWISKPDNSLSRNGVKIVTNFKELKENIDSTKYNDWIIQEYVENPLLLNKKKFHFRVYAIFVKTRESKTVYLMNYGFIYTASEEYNNDIITEGTHLTGEYKKENVFMFPDDITNIIGIQKWRKIVWPQIIKIVKETVMSVIDQLECPNKSINEYKCFKIFGYDILINNKLECYLAEINARNIGYKYPKEGFKEKYYDEILQCILNKKSLSTLELKNEDLPFERLLYIRNNKIIENFKDKISYIGINGKEIQIGFIMISLLLFIIIINSNFD